MTRLVVHFSLAFLFLGVVLAACGGGGGSDAAPGAGGTPGDDGAFLPDVALGSDDTLSAGADLGTAGSDGLLGTGGTGGGGDGSVLPTCGRPGFPCCPGNACSEGGCCVQGVCAASGAVCGLLGGGVQQRSLRDLRWRRTRLLLGGRGRHLHGRGHRLCEWDLRGLRWRGSALLCGHGQQRLPGSRAGLQRNHVCLGHARCRRGRHGR